MYKVIDNKSKANGTSLQGYITTTYEELVNRLGQPLKGSDDHKVTCEWILEFDSGDIVTIYDWKVSSTPKNLYNWQIGGFNLKAIDLLEEAINIQTRVSPF